MSSLRSLDTIALSLCVLLASGCNRVWRTEKTIGPEGGTVEVTDPLSGFQGVKLVVPAGAVAQATTFSIESAPEAPALPPGLGGDLPAVRFGPAATFSRDLTMVFPAPELPAAEGEILGAYRWNATQGRWAFTPARQVVTGQLIIAANELGLCGWGTIRLGEVDADTMRASMGDMQRLYDDRAQIEVAAQQKLDPLLSVLENPLSLQQCSTQDSVYALLASMRQDALAGVAAYLADPNVAQACAICYDVYDSGSPVTYCASGCDATELVSGQPAQWLLKEIEIWISEAFASSMPLPDYVAALGPGLGKMAASGKYRQAITELDCDWRCILKNGNAGFYADLLIGNACSFSMFGLEMYRAYYGCM